ncbi:chromate transporter [[Mycoplasma] gypis]|uniref:Chromate transporter n=1 Tax=[Mycoplasma] gypis TaxID=92404 RepID=A0ABZ2RP92_9BACT|nr:chromate transporter [[Mycoplasma] gypis]MBN0919072.1 chromate transporter [[Mycoplasma] gypis]
MVVFIAILLVLLSAFIVFGGGQVFMPLYQWIFNFLTQNFGAHISTETTDQIFAVANATPGIIGTKLAFFTGYLASLDENGNAVWWGYLAMFVTFLVMAIPAIIIMHFTSKALAKAKSNIYFSNLNLILKPVLSGIMFSLAIQLLFSVMFPYFSFNGGGISEYFKDNSSSLKARIFSGWRQYALYVWVPIAIVFTIFLQRKKVPLLYLISGSVVLGLIIFEPWLINLKEI